MSPRALRILVPALALAFLAPQAAAPAAAAYAVGTGSISPGDPARGGRVVAADLYYPAVVGGEGQPVAAPPPEGFAAVAFGHGYLLSPALYAWIATLLAGEGCVVAVAGTGGELFPSHAEFGLDLAFLARELRDAGEDPASPFFGRMGPRTAVLGHSMGGGASFLAAAGDPSLTAVANLAAAETSPSAIAACAGLARPVLVFAAGNDCVAPPPAHQEAMYAALAGGFRTLVTIAGASHCQFAAASLTCSLGETGCSPAISRQAQQDLTWALLRPWVRAVLFFDPDARQQFQQLLATTPGISWQQADALSDAGAGPPAARPRLAVAPNPFNPATVIRIELPAGGEVRLSVHDPRGRTVRLLARRALAAGRHEFTWDGRDAAGRAVPSGAYLVRLRTSAGTETRKAVLLR